MTSTRPRAFAEVFEAVRHIPSGKVRSYGQIGVETGVTARVVGWAMANVDDQEVPWHRVVGADGYLRIGRRSPELMAQQRSILQQEGVIFLDNGCVDMACCAD